MVRDDKGWLGMTRDDRNRTRDAGTRLGIRSHTLSIWTGGDVTTLRGKAAVVTNGCVKSLVRGSHVDTESGGRIGHIEDGESVAGTIWGQVAGV